MTITISNGNLTAQINPVGAELQSLKSNTNVEYIWEGNPEFWGKHSPVLFPIVGTLKKNTYQYNAIDYHLTRHGFARDLSFEIMELKEDCVIFSLQASKETLKNYPFDFELQLIYTLVENSLNIQYKVLNNGINQMPFSIGAHPAFALSRDFENYAIEFEQDETLNYFLLENDLISNKTKNITLVDKKIPLTYRLFENDALIFKKLQSNTLTIIHNLKPFLRVNFHDFPNLGIWTKINAPFVCIEPWHGYSDVLNSNGNLFEKEGMQILNPNEVFLTQYSIDVL
ncbi:aldose 1-epimerase family protein [Flavobacterium sp.]|uniref:aldose 1-epimerase family protein n=1 Tax=Flavobacterium sp. TaxID=239 RepID=UPI00286A6CEF|nr:aldose 1-epimerase family protein [Flavobacterium sp.]